MLHTTIVCVANVMFLLYQIQSVFILDQGWEPTGPLRVTSGVEEYKGPEIENLKDPGGAVGVVMKLGSSAFRRADVEKTWHR